MTFKLPSLESRKYEVGIATARILVDTPNSQVVEVSPKGSDTLGVRANLIANLMADGVVKTAIAERAGIPPEQLAGVAESAPGPPTEASPSPDQAQVLTTRVLATPDGDRLPIIEIEAQAPDAARAAKLADAAVAGLRDYLDSKAATEEVPDAERLRVSGLGNPQAHQAARGPRLLFAIAAALFVFGAGCAAILGFFAVVRGWRAAAAFEAFEDDVGKSSDTDSLEMLDDLFDRGHVRRPSEESEPVQARNG